MTRFLIIGASGFVGSAIFRDPRFDGSLAASVPFDRNPQSLLLSVEGRYATKDEILRFEPQVVINAAWHAIGNYTRDNALKNIDSQQKIFEFITSIPSVERVINFGSAWECENLGVCFEYPGLATSDFLTAKQFVFNLYSNFFGDRHYWLRLFYVYGLGSKKGILRYIVESILKNGDVKLDYPLSAVDYINILDVVNAVFDFSICTNKGGIYNIGSGTTVPNIAILEKALITLLPDDLQLIESILQAQGDNKLEVFWADTSKSENLPWRLNCRSIISDIPFLIEDILRSNQV
jgi:nucleoside-diphosphate-sugar epimerase